MAGNFTIDHCNSDGLVNWCWDLDSNDVKCFASNLTIDHCNSDRLVNRYWDLDGNHGNCIARNLTTNHWSDRLVNRYWNLCSNRVKYITGDLTINYCNLYRLVNWYRNLYLSSLGSFLAELSGRMMSNL